MRKRQPVVPINPFSGVAVIIAVVAISMVNWASGGHLGIIAVPLLFVIGYLLGRSHGRAAVVRKVRRRLK